MRARIRRWQNCSSVPEKCPRRIDPSDSSLRQRDIDRKPRQSQPFSECCGRHRADRIHPAAQDRGYRGFIFGDPGACLFQALGRDPMAVEQIGASGANQVIVIVPTIPILAAAESASAARRAIRRRREPRATIRRPPVRSRQDPALRPSPRLPPEAYGEAERHARGALQAAHRQDTRRDSRSESRAKTAMAPACQSRPSSHDPSSMRFRSSRQAVEIHGLMQAVVDGFVHQRMIRNADFAGEIFGDTRPDPETRPPADRRSACAESAAALFSRPGSAAPPAPATRSISSARRTSGPAAWPASAHAPPYSDSENRIRFPAETNVDRSSESSRPLSVAAACNSKLKVRQKRLRSARPQARLMREPNGA